MEAVEVKTKKQQKRFLAFRQKIYRENPIHVDNNSFMIKELFAGRTSFVKDKEILVVNIEDNGEILCQGMIVYARELPGYIQLCFFESSPGQEEAVNLLIKRAMDIGRGYGCDRLVVGLNGHVNYGLGFLCSHYDCRNSFSASVNPAYYNDYFVNSEFEPIYLNSYRIHSFQDKIKKYESMINRINRSYTFRHFSKKDFEHDTRIYTDLNNICFDGHRYYYPRTYAEDREMLKELFLFMKEDSVIFAFDGDKPVGFIMWYPDFNMLVKDGDAFGVKEFFKNILFGATVKTGKVMEYGILEEYRKSGLAIGLVYQVFLCMQKRGMKDAESSWVLEENTDSNSICNALCDEEYKRYVVYEKII